MMKHHLEILREILNSSKNTTKNAWVASYLRTPHFHYNLQNSVKKQIAKTWAKNNKQISLNQFSILLTSLYKGKSYEEKSIAGYLLYYFPKLRKQVRMRKLDSWLGELDGWAEIDNTCQSNFTAEEILSRWKEWKSLTSKLSSDKNINKRRASLVLLTLPVRNNPDDRISLLAFQTIETLKHEKHVLITKAISWLLRDLTYLHRKEVEEYLESNFATLPKIAVRETKRKLLTGKK